MLNVTEADAYVALLPSDTLKTNWAALTPAIKNSYLSYAIAYVNNLPWRGELRDVTQENAWPREGVDCMARALPTTIPSGVLEYTAVVAAHIATLGDEAITNANQDIGRVMMRREKLGPLETEVEYSAGVPEKSPFTPPPIYGTLIECYALAQKFGVRFNYPSQSIQNFRP